MDYQINKKILLIILVTALNSCLFENYKPPRQKATKKELLYVDKLLSEGYKNINLFIPAIGEVPSRMNHYALELDCPFELKHENTDSVIQVRYQIADELYSNIVEDSIIMDCSEFNIRLNFQKEEFDPYKNDNLTDGILISVLEKRNGFKIVTIGEKKYKRIPVK